MKLKKKKVISVSLFIIGLGFMLYPILSKKYNDYRYRLEAERLVEIMRGENFDGKELYEKQKTFNEINKSSADIEMADVGFVDEAKNTTDDFQFTMKDTLGVLHIPKINLTYPILDGAMDENLARSVARIDGTSYPVGGKNTNSVISGHNGWASKTFFSKITQLKNGDLIEIHNQKETLTYEVFATDVIEPTDTGALAVRPDEDLVTLLTCTYPPPGTHRYLVFGKRVLPKEVEGGEEE